MNYTSCPLYGLNSKKLLKYLLYIKNPCLFRQNYVASLIDPYIDFSGKPRLIEPPREELKIVQKRIKTLLGKIEVPDNVFSGIKGRSYIGNASIHKSRHPRNLFKIDLSAFFPSISRDTIYNFFVTDLCCSPDVACILTNFTTIDIYKANGKNREQVLRFLDYKGIKTYNHLISGAPTSQILSYLANHRMFDEMQHLSDLNGVTMSIYVDDVTFSSEFAISQHFKNIVFSIIKKYKYHISISKVKSYSKTYPKLVTGVIIGQDGKLKIKNSIRKKIVSEYDHLLSFSDDIESKQRLKGLVAVAQQVDKSAYPYIRNFAYKSSSNH